jgi:hypothetical protein
MMKGLVILGVILSASFVAGQGQIEHAPTVARCQADQRLWLAQLEVDARSNTLPTVDVIRTWSSGMMKCEDVDAANRLKYYDTESEIITERMLRLEHFLDRHDLWQKFKAEDAAGVR